MVLQSRWTIALTKPDFTVECTKLRLAAGLCPGPLGQLTALPQVPWLHWGREGREGVQEGRREDGKGGMEWEGNETEKGGAGGRKGGDARGGRRGRRESTASPLQKFVTRFYNGIDQYCSCVWVYIVCMYTVLLVKIKLSCILPLYATIMWWIKIFKNPGSWITFPFLTLRHMALYDIF